MQKEIFILFLFLAFAAGIQAETLKYKTMVKNLVYKEAECKVRLMYPDLASLFKANGNAIQKALEAKILTLLDFTDKKPASMNEVPDMFFSAFKKGAREMEDGGFSPMPWELNLDSGYLEGADGIILVKITVFSFTGGAHPNTMAIFWNYDSPAGREITVSDILKKNAEPDLKRIGEAHFRPTRGMKEGDSYESVGCFLDAGEFRLPANYGFAKEGLVFYYNTYEIAAYVTGPTQFTVPWTELKDLINRKW
jgi:hypothetical protein